MPTTPPPIIEFKPKTEKIIEVILHLAHKGIPLDRYKLVKLVYLADITHLNRYSRFITDDKMVAMKNGPVPSTLYDILCKRKRRGVDYANMPFDYVTKGDRHYIENPKREIRRGLFSKSDLEVLDEVFDQYGKSSFGELYDLTHSHIGFQRAWQSRGSRWSKPILVEDLVDEGPDKAEFVDDMRFYCRNVF